MTSINLGERLDHVPYSEVKLYLQLYRIWGRQKKINIIFDMSEKGSYAFFDTPEDALLFKLTVFQYRHKVFQ